MRHILKNLLLAIFILFVGFITVKAQSNWNSIYYAPSVPNQGLIYSMKRSITVDGKLYLYGDTTGSYFQSPYVLELNPQNNNGTPLSMSTYSLDNKATSAAAISSPTPGASYIYFGTTGSSPHYPGIYRLNTQTNAVTRDSLANGMDTYHYGIDNMIFFNNSGAATHDTLTIFANYFGSINVYRKHHSQIGGATSETSIPFQNIYESMVYRDTLYVFGYSTIVNNPALYKTSDGLTYTECTDFSNMVMTLGGSASYGFDMDTLNNTLYLVLGDNESSTHILTTNNGSSFSETQAGGYYTRYVSCKNYKNRMWLSGKSMSFSYNSNDLVISYLNAGGADIKSVDTLGFQYNAGQFYHLNVLNDSLYCAGHFDFSTGMAKALTGTDYYSGYSIYKLTPPVAGLTPLTNTNVCLNSSTTFTSTSMNTDSTAWFYDNAFVAMSPGATAWYNFGNSTAGTHTISLVAYGAAITDTVNYEINVYDLNASLISPSGTLCENTEIVFSVNASGINGDPINYQWIKNGGQLGTNDDSLTIMLPAGSYTVNAIASDSQCSSATASITVNVNSSTNIMGTATTGTSPAVPVAGNVVLYKYEPFLTKFDSIDYQTLDAAGGYTFTSATAGNYIAQVIPSSSTLQITYGTSEVTWQNATTLSHGCLSNATFNIDVKPFASLPGLGTGPGTMSGQIVQALGFGQKPNGSYFKPTAPGNPIGGIVVKGGRNPGGQMFTQTTTDPVTGTYTLTGLPINNNGTTGTEYFIQVDIPGLDTNQTYHRTITVGNNQYLNLDFTVDSIYVNPVNNSSVGINDINAIEHQLAIYPNPTENHVNINFSLATQASVSAGLYNITGQEVKSLIKDSNLQADKYKYQISLNEISAGIYFIKLNIAGKISTTKLCITH